MESPPDAPPLQPTPRRKRGGTETRQREYRITFRMSAAEYVELEAAASEAGLTLASYARSRALSAPTTRARHRAPVDIVALAAVLRAFTKVAININQIARHLNMNGIPIPEELMTVAVRLDADRVAVMSLMRRP
jgi:hypothetical protein